jgi:hypothetical protein
MYGLRKEKMAFGQTWSDRMSECSYCEWYPSIEEGGYCKYCLELEVEE